MICISIGIRISTVELKICAKTEGITKYKSIIVEKKKRHDKMVLLERSKLNRIEVFISKTSIDSNISHDEFLLINNVWKEYDYMKEEIKNLKT